MSEWSVEEPMGNPTKPPMLTKREHEAMDKTVALWKDLHQIVGEGEARGQDLRELMFHIHGLQRAIMAQAACRAYPDQYRLLGGDPFKMVE